MFWARVFLIFTVTFFLSLQSFGIGTSTPFNPAQPTISCDVAPELESVSSKISVLSATENSTHYSPAMIEHLEQLGANPEDFEVAKSLMFEAIQQLDSEGATLTWNDLLARPEFRDIDQKNAFAQLAFLEAFAKYKNYDFLSWTKASMGGNWDASRFFRLVTGRRKIWFNGKAKLGDATIPASPEQILQFLETAYEISLPLPIFRTWTWGLHVAATKRFIQVIENSHGDIVDVLQKLGIARDATIVEKLRLANRQNEAGNRLDFALISNALSLFVFDQLNPIFHVTKFARPYSIGEDSEKDSSEWSTETWAKVATDYGTKSIRRGIWLKSLMSTLVLATSMAFHPHDVRTNIEATADTAIVMKSAAEMAEAAGGALPAPPAYDAGLVEFMKKPKYQEFAQEFYQKHQVELKPTELNYDHDWLRDRLAVYRITGK